MKSIQLICTVFILGVVLSSGAKATPKYNGSVWDYIFKTVFGSAQPVQPSITLTSIPASALEPTTETTEENDDFYAAWKSTLAKYISRPFTSTVATYHILSSSKKIEDTDTLDRSYEDYKNDQANKEESNATSAGWSIWKWLSPPPAVADDIPPKWKQILSADLNVEKVKGEPQAVLDQVQPSSWWSSIKSMFNLNDGITTDPKANISIPVRVVAGNLEQLDKLGINRKSLRLTNILRYLRQSSTRVQAPENTWGLVRLYNHFFGPKSENK